MCKCHATIGETVCINNQDYFRISNHKLDSYLDEYPTGNVTISFEIIANAKPIQEKKIKKSSSFAFLNKLFHF